MKIVRESKKGISYLGGLLKDKVKVVTKVLFWKIPRSSGKEEISLKIGRYNKGNFNQETLECTNPKSELTLDHEEFENLIHFLKENYDPFREGTTKYISLDDTEFDQKNIEHLRALFSNPDQKKVLNFIGSHKILSNELIVALENQKRIKAIQVFEEMLKGDLVENDWQKWFKENNWVLGSEFVRILDERNIDTDNIADYLMQAYDGFLDIIEIKRPGGDLCFWSKTLDHGNCIPSIDLIKAVTQATKYILDVEREANSIKFLERVDYVKTIKPRCVLIFGRSNSWGNEQKEAFRILNSSYHNLTIMTYDHVLDRAKRIVGIEHSSNQENDNRPSLASEAQPNNENKVEIKPEDLPF